MVDTWKQQLLQVLGITEMTKKANIDEILTLNELCQYLKIPKSTVYKLCQEGRIPGQKVGRHWRFRRATIDGWLDSEGDNDPTLER